MEDNKKTDKEELKKRAGFYKKVGIALKVLGVVGILETISQVIFGAGVTGVVLLVMLGTSMGGVISALLKLWVFWIFFGVYFDNKSKIAQQQHDSVYTQSGELARTQKRFTYIIWALVIIVVVGFVYMMLPSFLI
jgi:hypothetical protein